MCRNWLGGPNLQCLVAPGSSAEQYLCSPTQYFHNCDDYCYSSKSWQQSCNLSTCCAIKRDHSHASTMYAIVPILNGGTP